MNQSEKILKKQRDFFATGVTQEASFRLEQLNKLKQVIQRFEPAILEALHHDLNKSELDTYSTELGMVLSEINYLTKNLVSWMKAKRVKTPLTHIGSRSFIYPEPYGVALIISPWNYPFQLTLAPLLGAMAAGNCAILKPSELSPHVSRVIAEMMSSQFPSEYIAVIEGGAEASTELLNLKFDKIFFTGSVVVGKIVAQAAAQYLTPVTLELGGKSPCIVHKDAKLDLAAKRIVWGKFLNAGQTCIAPDYLFVHKDVKEELVEHMQGYIRNFYGQDSQTMLQNNDLTVIVNDRHFQRLITYLERAHVLAGGGYDEKRRFIEPTILDQVDWNHPVMQEEIFGPILPVLEYEDLEEVIAQVNEHEKPLALYFFSENKGLQDRILQGISFGGGCFNDTVMHIVTPYLPFGGVGNSGNGAYHGKSSFEAFSHQKSILSQSTQFDLPVRYPSFKYALQAIRFLMK
ncbi:aldehyde dehydrogenase [Desulfitobacterium metallireducens]|uniref:Aldehyde dehydrogenase n=1 Tax=Desulfitobacterium metallireducens DSM 15288 TaxID=871968 RepID=W0EFZ5_9FIRM|nr:aldehyde dehydrogenase [Desulfitobacterium metallireducens]AHF08129.1 aldehyde dehydrogenase [Desulfitobacterium metallireducens DSM 15288]